MDKGSEYLRELEHLKPGKTEVSIAFRNITQRSCCAERMKCTIQNTIGTLIIPQDAPETFWWKVFTLYAMGICSGVPKAPKTARVIFDIGKAVSHPYPSFCFKALI